MEEPRYYCTIVHIEHADCYGRECSGKVQVEVLGAHCKLICRECARELGHGKEMAECLS
jgi:hypothetical protein